MRNFLDIKNYLLTKFNQYLIPQKVGFISTMSRSGTWYNREFFFFFNELLKKKSKEQKSKKAIKEKQARVVEDATFGLKNKNKSAKVQKFVAQVQKTVNNSNTNKVKSDQAKKDKQLNKRYKITNIFL